MALGARWALALVALFCFQPCCAAQSFNVNFIDRNGHGGYWPKWDPVQARLLLYRNAYDPSVPAARIFSQDGTSVDIYLLRDLSGSKYIEIWNAAAAPNGGLVLAAIVGYTPKGVKPAELKSFMFTYDGTGTLTKVWDMLPYHDHLLAVDAEGDVFAFGDADLPAPYPLLVKYSPKGKVLRQFLYSSSFNSGDQIVDEPSPNGLNQMFIENQTLYLWVASSEELLRFTLAGDLVSRVSLSQALETLPPRTGTKRAVVRDLTVTPDGQIVAQVQLWTDHPGPTNPVRLWCTRISPSGSTAELTPISLEPAWLLGRTNQGKLLFLEPDDAKGRTGRVVTW